MKDFKTTSVDEEDGQFKGSKKLSVCSGLSEKGLSWVRDTSEGGREVGGVCGRKYFEGEISRQVGGRSSGTPVRGRHRLLPEAPSLLSTHTEYRYALELSDFISRKRAQEILETFSPEHNPVHSNVRQLMIDSTYSVLTTRAIFCP